MDAGATSYFERTNVTGDRIAYDDPACYDDAHDDSDPAYSPDGSKIVFERGQPDSENPYRSDDEDIFVMPASGQHDGSGKTNLTDHPTLESYDPDWGPACASCPGVPPPGERDATDPTITGPRPAPGSEVRDRTPTVRVVVRDEADELTRADIGLRVDGGPRAYPTTPRPIASRAPRKSSPWAGTPWRSRPPTGWATGPRSGGPSGWRGGSRTPPRGPHSPYLLEGRFSEVPIRDPA